MTDVVILSSSRGLKKVTCVNSTSPPASVAGTGNDLTLSGIGIYSVADGFAPLSSGAAGVQKFVKIVPCNTTSGSYTLVVYGAFYFIDQWLWVPLFKATVAATLAHTGVSSANSIATTSFLPATITTASGAPSTASADITSYGSSDGPAHVKVETRGCPYLLFQASVGTAFVAVGGQS